MVHVDVLVGRGCLALVSCALSLVVTVAIAFVGSLRRVLAFAVVCLLPL